MTNTLTQSTLTPRAQLFTLALAALVAPTTTAFSAVGAADVGPDYITGGDALLVPVGDAGNPANTDGHGGVPYGYSIGKYEVTNAQYALFLNAVDPTGANALSLYNSDGMSGTYGGIEKSDSAADGYKYAVKSGNAGNGMSWADMPVNYVSFWDAARFCNWLTNGGTAGASTETGVYTLVGGTPTPTNSSVTRNVEVNGSTLTGTGDLAGKSQTVYAVPSENEWYKAAYHNGDGTYRTYPTTKDDNTAPTQTTEANYSNAFGSPYLAEVDYYDGVEVAGSYYGTFQQGGNVWEWNDTIVNVPNTRRGARGGSFDQDFSSTKPSASEARDYLNNLIPEESNVIGFRVSSLLITSVPEPSTYGILGGAAALLGAVALRRRNRRD